MKTLSEEQFLAWANSNNLGLDDKYPDLARLEFKPSSDLSRFWIIPSEPERRPYFIFALLELMGEWSSCLVWRHLGSWPASPVYDRINDRIEFQILKGIGLPLGRADIVEFTKAEIDLLIILIFSTTIFGWSVGEDLYVVPDNGLFIMKVSHHEVIHLSFRRPEDMVGFIENMNNKGFPLPNHVPDATFKIPKWMKPNGA